MEDKYILNICLTGSVPTKAMNPFVPLTTEEIVADVKSCLDAGATVFHIHARDDRGFPDWRKERYQEIITALRLLSEDAVICFTTTGRKVKELSKRVDCLQTDPPPDMASLTLGSFNFMNDASMTDPAMIRAIAQAMEDRGVKPEIEIFDIGMARTMTRLRREGLLKAPIYANVILGNAGSAGAALSDAAAVLQHVPEDVIWCGGGIGPEAQVIANQLGLLYGKGVRVGLEDNIYVDRKKNHATNAELARRVVESARLMGKTPYSISETRKLLGLVDR